MMNSRELRYGNYIKGIGVDIYWTVDGFQNGFIFASNQWRMLDSFEPIPLTEEWLLKFGFHEKYKSTANRWCLDGWCIFDCEDEEGNLSGNFMYEFRTHIKYVHQLQNLYFALTNEELTYEQ